MFGNTQYIYHIRMKGVPKEAVIYKAEKLGITPFELYNRMYNSEKVEFDIAKGNVKFLYKLKLYDRDTTSVVTDSEILSKKKN